MAEVIATFYFWIGKSIMISELIGLVEQIKCLIEPELFKKGFELVETVYRRESGSWILRLFIDKQDPLDKKSHVSLDDCEKISELVGMLLDTSEILIGSYTLEVSSPGINRPLKNEAHYLRFLGENVKVSIFSPISSSSNQRNFSGTLLNCKEKTIEIDDKTSGRVTIPLEQIAKANLDII